MVREATWTRVGVFALVLLVSLSVGAAGAFGGDGSSPSVEELSLSTYTDPDTVAAVPAESGSVEMSADAEGAVVVVDAGHGASLTREQLAPLVTTLTENGATVEFFSGGEQGLNASLSRADAYVAFGAERQYTSGELAGIEQFADAGGRVLLLGEPSQAPPYRGYIVISRPTRGSHPAPMTELSSRFGIAFGNGYLYDMHDYDTNYRNVYASPAGDGRLVEGVDRLVLHESVPVSGPRPLVQTTETTELSETRKQRQYDVVVRSGNVVAVGDSSVVSQDFYRRADNEAFVGNLLDFLVSGEKRPADAPQSASEDDEREERRPTPRPPR